MKIFNLFDKKPVITEEAPEKNSETIDEGIIRVTIEEAVDINDFESQEARTILIDTLVKVGVAIFDVILLTPKERQEWFSTNEKKCEHLFRDLLKSAKMENKAVLKQVVKEAFSEMLIHHSVSRIPEGEVF